MSTPPTIHDSDRKAAEAIHRFDDATDAEIETTAIIIARHHAEERAAVENVKVLAANVLQQRDWHRMSYDERLLVQLLEADDYLTKTDAGFSGFTTAKTDAALTALRTASQSPTEGKT